QEARNVHREAEPIVDQFDTLAPVIRHVAWGTDRKINHATRRDAETVEPHLAAKLPPTAHPVSEFQRHLSRGPVGRRRRTVAQVAVVEPGLVIEPVSHCSRVVMSMCGRYWTTRAGLAVLLLVPRSPWQRRSSGSRWPS